MSATSDKIADEIKKLLIKKLTMETKSKEQLQQLTIPELKQYLKARGIGGYTGLKREQLIEYALNPPPRESQRSPGRPKGIGGTGKTPRAVVAAVAPVGSIIPAVSIASVVGTSVLPPPVITSTIMQPQLVSVPVPPSVVPSVVPQTAVLPAAEVLMWNSENLSKINLVSLKAILKRLGVAGYSGKPKSEVLAALLVQRIPSNFSVTLEDGRTITFTQGTVVASAPMAFVAPSVVPTPFVAPTSFVAPGPSILSLAEVKTSPRQPAPILTPISKKIVNLKLAEVDIGEYGDQTVEQPNVGSLVYIGSLPGHQTYIVTEITQDASQSYTETVMLHPVIKVDQANYSAFVDESGPGIYANLNLVGQPRWVLVSNPTAALVWGSSNV